jgi:hypothetical protein
LKLFEGKGIRHVARDRGMAGTRKRRNFIQRQNESERQTAWEG